MSEHAIQDGDGLTRWVVSDMVWGTTDIDKEFTGANDVLAAIDCDPGERVVGVVFTQKAPATVDIERQGIVYTYRLHRYPGGRYYAFRAVVLKAEVSHLRA